MLVRFIFPRMLALIATVGIGGCALGDRTVTLAYPPEAEEGVAATALAAPVAVAPGATVALVPFEDERSQTTMVGDVRNAYGMHTADVVAANDVPGWVTSAVRSDLQQAGFDVLDVVAADETLEHPVITGEVVNVYATAYWSYEAEVSFYGRVQRGREIVLDQLYAGTGGAGTNWAATEAGYGQSLALALQDAVRPFIADIKGLSN